MRPLSTDDLPFQPEPAPTRTADDSFGRLAMGERLAGRYRILELVGIGGMGMVYKAEDEQLGLPVAIKILRSDLARDHRRLERFKQELVLARQVSHPNVVRIHDLGTDGDLVFLSMDFIPGRSLQDLLAREGKLTAERAAGIARQIAQGLAVAHEAGVVHRDLKPGNILVDESGRAAISDFGVARSLSSPGLTLPGAVVGTLDYLAPEQARGGEIDGRTDLYALGIVLYEMMTGELPFAGGSATEVLAQRLTGATRDLASAGVEVPPHLAAVVRRLLQLDPERRYANARELLADLERPAAEPPRPRRPRRVLWAALLGIIPVLALLGWLGYQSIQGVGFARQEPAPDAAASATKAAVAAGHAVALLPLADETGREDLAWVAAGLPEMLAATLAEGPGLRVLDSRRVFQTLEALKLAPGPLPEREARRLAELLDADRLVSGRVRAAGNLLRIDLSLVATDLPGLPAQTLKAESEPGDAFRLIDQIGATLREQLAAPPAPAGRSVSRSPVALAAYAKGSASLRRGDAISAVADLERAVAGDPGYGAAWVQLARAREALGRREAAREAARRAVATLGAVESRSAYEARAIEARLLGRPDKAQEILARLVERYPGDAEARVELAETYGEQGSLDRAIASLQEVVELAPHHPRAWFLLAKYSILAGDVRRAIDDYLVHALVVQNQLGSEEGRADVLNAFGVAWRELGEVERAAESYGQAAAIRRRIGDERGYATTLRNLASLDSMRGEHAAAGRRLAEALAILERLGDGPGIADLHDEFGVLAEERGDYEEALRRYQQALRVRRDLGNDVAFATSFANVGYACYLLGRYDDAMVYWRQGLDLARQSGDPAGVVVATQNLGLLELARGDWDEATKSFLGALGTSRELGMKQAIASSLGHLGRLAQYQGRPVAALASFAEALAVLREVGDRRGLAEFTLAQAEVEIELGIETAADQSLRKAAELLSAENNREQQAELERLRGEWHLLRGESAAARTALRRAVTHAQESRSVVELLDTRLSAAFAGFTPGRERQTLAELERLSEQAEALGHARLRLRAAELVARAALAAGTPGTPGTPANTERARRAAAAGLERADASGGWFGAWRLHLLLAEAHERAGRPAEAAAERERGAGEIARVSRDLAPGQRQSFHRLSEVRELADRIETGRAGRKG
ncbi:MAG TPA: protein kinase [Thermoanaerobaculia bacterium]|nr:protein kinase [Thermoanaerobaculia bacterium]